MKTCISLNLIHNYQHKIGLIIIIFCIYGCVNSPPSDDLLERNDGNNCCFILNEGIRSADNASISKYNFDNNSYTNYYFRKSNNNLKLGDNANDIMLYDSLVFVSVSGTGVIEVFNIFDGKFRGRITFPKWTMPRRMVLVNDTLCFVSSYVEYSDYYLYYFNPSDLLSSQQAINDNKILVGSHPEGLCYDSLHRRLYVVNSGYGNIDYDNPTASTISIIDIDSKTEITKIKTDVNPNRIYLANGKLYVICWGLYSEGDKGSIIEYEINTMTITRLWFANAYDICFNKTQDSLYFINSTWDFVGSSGIYLIDLNEIDPVPQLIIPNPNKYDMWTAIQINFADNSLWVANSFRFNSDGEIMIYDRYNGLILRRKFFVGNIPNNIRFVQ